VVQVSLWWDHWKVREQVEDLLVRLECLRECSLQEQGQVPDWVLGLERELDLVLEQVPAWDRLLEQDRDLEQERDQMRQEVRQVLERLEQDPQHQELMRRLAVSEAQDRVQELEKDPEHQELMARLAVSEAQDRVHELEQELEQAQALVRERERVVVKVEDLGWLAEGPLTEL
jgi:hypothetical protein